MLSNNEIILFKLALYWYKKYDESNPDVGMGNFDTTLLSDLEKQIGITLTPQDRQRILQ